MIKRILDNPNLFHWTIAVIGYAGLLLTMFNVDNIPALAIVRAIFLGIGMGSLLVYTGEYTKQRKEADALIKKGIEKLTEFDMMLESVNTLLDNNPFKKRTVN